jgi:hypothetical protein
VSLPLKNVKCGVTNLPIAAIRTILCMGLEEEIRSVLIFETFYQHFNLIFNSAALEFRRI